MKRILSLFLSLVLIFSVVQTAFTVSAAEYSFDGIILSEGEITLNTDSGGKKQHTLTVIYVDENGQEVEATENTAILWLSSEEKVVPQPANGVVTALSNGEAIVTAKVFVNNVPTDIVAQCKVTVRDSIDKHYISLREAIDAIPEDYDTSGIYIEATVQQLKALIDDIDWELEDTVENCALVDGITAEVIAKTEGLLEHTTAISITDYPEEVTVGDEDFVISFEQTGYDDVQWTSDNNDVATVDNTGKVTILGGCPDAEAPTVTFTVASYGFSDSCTVRINNPIAAVALDKTEYALFTGEAGELVATASGKDANAPITHNYALTWESDNEEVATVENGAVTAVKAGETKIRVYYSEEIYAECILTVTDPTPVSSLEIKSKPERVTAGFTAMAEVTLLPADATYTQLLWESEDENIVKVVSKGTKDGIATAEIAGVAPGKATITYSTTDGSELSGSFEIEVIPYSGIALAESEIILNTDAGGKLTQTLAVLYLDDNGDPVEFTGESILDWSSDNDLIATVENGTVTAVANGSCSISVTDELTGKTAGCTVTVRDSIKKYYGDFDAVAATIPADYKQEGRYLPSAVEAVDALMGQLDRSLEDTVENCLSVEELTQRLAELIEELKAAEIAAPDDTSFWGKWNIAYSLMPSNKDAYMAEGIAKLEEIAETVYGESGDKIWLRSDKAALDKLADEFIAAFGELKLHTTTIEIIDPPASKRVSDEEFFLVYEADGEDTVQWTSSNDSVASVDEYGKVTIHGGCPDASNPTVTFTATANGISASCTVRIENPPVSAKMAEKPTVGYNGHSLQIELETIGVDSKAPVTEGSYEIKWTTDNDVIATVENGLVSFHHTGECIISFSINNGQFKESCSIDVKEPVPANLLSNYSVPSKVTVGMTAQATVEVLPAQTSFPQLKWSSGDENKATVTAGEENGNMISCVITGVSTGMVTINYETTDGSNLSGSFTVEVVPDREVILSQDSITLNTDEYGISTAILTATFSDENGSVPADASVIEWSTTNINIASVNGGKITAKENGTCNIIATDKVTGRTAVCRVTVRDTIKALYEKLDVSIAEIPSDYKDADKYDSDIIAELQSHLDAVVRGLEDTEENCNTVSTWKFNIDKSRIALVESEFATADDFVLWYEIYNSINFGELGKYTEKSVKAVYDIIDEFEARTWLKNEKELINQMARDLAVAVVNLKERTTSIEITSAPLQWKVGNEPFRIYYDVTGYDDIIWQVSAEDVLTVENSVDEYGVPCGLVTVNRGCEDASDPFVTITVLSGEYSDSCRIKILNPLAGIKLSEEKIVIGTNETLQLEIIKFGVDPERPVTEEEEQTAIWMSEMTNIATVNNGLVTPVEAGTMCKITAVYGPFTAECDVTVKKVYPVEKFVNANISSGKSYVTVNDTITASVFVYPARATNKVIEWTSEDESIATVVSNGTNSSSIASAAVIGVSEGETTITYRTTDGTNISGSFTIVVNPLVSSITLDKEELLVYIGEAEESYKLTATVLPENAGNQVLNWVSSDENVATVVNGKLEILSVGTTTITANATDGTAHFGSCNVTVVGDAAEMSISRTSASLKVGESLALYSTVTTKEGATYDVTDWSSSDPSKAKVDSQGRVEALLPGTVTITGKSFDGTEKTCKITITADLYGISLAEAMTLAVGKTRTMTASYDPSYATNKNVTWRSTNPSVATVNATTGRVSAIKVGTTYIIATSEEGGYTATCKVSVVVPVESLSISKTSYSLTMGSKTSVKLTAKVNPSNATNKSIQWKTSNNKVATVDSNGNVKAVGPGVATITVTTLDGGYSRTCKITVIQPVSGVKFSSSKLEMYVSQSKTFSYSVSPSNATDKGVSFKSSNTKVATVDSKGKVKAKKTGTCTIYVITDDGEYKAKCKVTVVKKVDVKSVKLNYSSASVDKGKTLTLKATISPKSASNKNVTWKSSDTSIATVNSKGVVTGKKGGTVTITCTTKDKSKKAACKVKVYEAVSSIKLNAGSMSLATGKSRTLTATISPSTATNKSVKWYSSNTSIATVSSKGKVTAKKAGTTYITAKSKDNSKITVKCKVTIVQSPTKITLNQKEIEIKTGARHTLTATVSPSNSYDKSVTWYSNKPSVCRVSDSGVITGMKAGTATIICKSAADESVKRSCVVTVVEPVLGVSLSAKSLTMTTGRTKTLIPTISPENATNKSVTWKSSDKSVVEVNKKGAVEAVGPGVATVTCTTKDGLYVAKCVITVRQPVISVRLDRTSTTLSIGSTRQLKATIKPSDATNQEVIWRSSNSKIAKVTQSGRVTALKEGTVKITCTTEDGGLVAVCTVKCVIPVEGVSLNKTSRTIKKGSTYTLKAKIYPTDATIKDVTWSSSNKSVATVNKNGKVTAKKKGTAIITCKTKNGGYKIKCKITVK